MKRSMLVLALASISIVASAADKPLPVTVTNPVLPVEVSNADPISVSAAGAAVNVNTSGSVINYYSLETMYTNTGSRPVAFTGLSVSVFSLNSCASSAAPIFLNFIATPDGSSNTPGAASVGVQLPSGQDRYNSGCVWIVSVPAGLVVGPGQQLVGFVEFRGPTTATLRYSASGYQLR